MNEVHIQSVGGELRIVNFETPTDITVKKFKALLSQVGAGDVTRTDLQDDFNISAIGMVRTAAGKYKLTSVGTFPTATTSVKIGTPSILNAEIIAINPDNDSINIETSTPVGTHADGILVRTAIEVEVKLASAPTTTELIFDNILTKLDANQLKLWKKIVVRYGGTVTEIDGKNYRLTSVYADATTVINS